jgi:hypothetical protein
MRLAFIVLGLIISPVFVAEAGAQESACVAIENDAQRLACYDAANGRAPRVAPDLPQAAPAPERSGVLPSFGNFLNGDDEPAQQAAPVAYQIASVRLIAGRPAFVMGNGEVWAAAETPARNPRTGEQVTITREGVGYFVLRPASGAPFRVRRQ